MLPGQLHISCNFFFDLLLKEHSTVVYDALDLCLVVHVLYKLDASVVRCNRCAFLVSLITPVEIPQFGLDPFCLVVEAPAIPIELIGGMGIVLPRPGRLVPSTNVD